MGLAGPVDWALRLQHPLRKELSFGDMEGPCQMASFAWKSLHIQRPIVIFISGFPHTSQKVSGFLNGLVLKASLWTVNLDVSVCTRENRHTFSPLPSS